jgi:hypothetical protein
MMAACLRVGFVRNVIQEAILAIEAEIEERQRLISKLRELSVRPATVERADGIACPKWSAVRRRRFNATWTKKKADRHRGESHLSSPATPPDKRVRIRRFGRIELLPRKHPWKSK